MLRCQVLGCQVLRYPVTRQIKSPVWRGFFIELLREIISFRLLSFFCCCRLEGSWDLNVGNWNAGVGHDFDTCRNFDAFDSEYTHPDPGLRCQLLVRRSIYQGWFWWLLLRTNWMSLPPNLTPGEVPKKSNRHVNLNFQTFWQFQKSMWMRLSLTAWNWVDLTMHLCVVPSTFNSATFEVGSVNDVFTSWRVFIDVDGVIFLTVDHSRNQTAFLSSFACFGADSGSCCRRYWYAYHGTYNL